MRNGSTIQRDSTFRLHWPGEQVIPGKNHQTGKAIVTLKAAIVVRYAQTCLPADWRNLPLDQFFQVVQARTAEIAALVPKCMWITVDGGPGWAPHGSVNVASYIKHVLEFFDLDLLRIQCSAGGQSKYNPIEREWWDDTRRT